MNAIRLLSPLYHSYGCIFSGLSQESCAGDAIPLTPRSHINSGE